MTRDELIARTRQLIDEGERLAANPSLGALQLWLQLSRRPAVDRVGEHGPLPPGVAAGRQAEGHVRGRAMTAEEEAAYVREVAEQKTAALRMSLDAVERQGMPFLGETGGVGRGDQPKRADTDASAAPDAERRAAREARPAQGPVTYGAPRRRAPAGRGASRPRRATRPSSRAHAAVTADRRVPAVGGTRTVPEPDAIARDYLLLGLRLDQQVPGLIDAYYGPASLKAEVEIEPKRSAASLREDAASLRARVADEIDAPDRRTWLTAQLVALEAQASVLAGDTLPYVDLVAQGLRLRTAPRPGRGVRCRSRAGRRAPARRRRSLPSALRPGMPSSRSPRSGYRP